MSGTFDLQISVANLVEPLTKFFFSFQMSENEVLEPSTLVSFVDKQRIQVLTRSTPTPNLQGEER